MQLVSFSDEYLVALHQAFIAAFSDYNIPFQPSLEAFKNRIYQKLNIHYGLSRLAIENETVVGFVLHTVGQYQEKTTVYDAGIGVIPSHRKRGIASQLMTKTIETLQEADLNRIVLEVITGNHAALGLYENFGFQKRGMLKCFKGKDLKPRPMIPEVTVVQSNDWRPGKYESMVAYTPSFMDSDPQLTANIRNETILEAYWNDALAGYIIFQPRTGRISQFAVLARFRRNGVGGILIHETIKRTLRNELSILNVPASETDTINALKHLGFINQVDQYEMELVISDR